MPSLSGTLSFAKRIGFLGGLTILLAFVAMEYVTCPSFPAGDMTHYQRGAGQQPKLRGRFPGPLRCKTLWTDRPATEEYLWGNPGERYTTQGCRNLQEIRCSGNRSRALVIYMVQTKDSPHDMQQEMWNLHHFVRYGVFGEEESTAMFDRVDYIFTRMKPNGSSVPKATLCAQEGNMKFFWVPDGPCDLCAHGRIIEYLGGAAKVMKEYGFLVLTNAGSRGPLQSEDAPHWIDVLAMGGQSELTERTPPLMVGPSIKPHPIHVESHAVGLNTRLLKEHMHFLKVHCNGTKLRCILHGEHRAGPAWLKNGGWLHGLSRNVTIHNATEGKPYQELNKKYQVRQPLREYYDVCAAMFAKHGGSFTNSTMLKETTAAHTAQLTFHQSPRRQLRGGETFRKLMSRCNVLQL